jgi:hypothetical protein
MTPELVELPASGVPACQTWRPLRCIFLATRSTIVDATWVIAV